MLLVVVNNSLGRRTRPSICDRHEQVPRIGAAIEPQVHDGLVRPVLRRGLGQRGAWHGALLNVIARVELRRKEEELLGDSHLIRAAQSTAYQMQSSVISS